jgi:hypothetical protein
VHKVLYEDLVQHPREVAQELLEVCGLPWEDKVLDFQQLARPVATASLAQVRPPCNVSGHVKYVASSFSLCMD